MMIDGIFVLLYDTRVTERGAIRPVSFDIC